MPTLYDQALANASANPNPPTMFDQAMSGAIAPPDPLMAQSYHYTSPLFRGVASGAQGLRAATNAYGGALTGAMGMPQASQSFYDDASEAQLRSAIAQPDIHDWSQVNSPNTALQYAWGKVGEAVPMLTPALAGSGLARAVGAGPVGSYLGGAAPLFPAMAGGAVERMRADPATAHLSPGELARNATMEGGLNSLVGEAVPYALQGRALGLRGLAARPGLSVTRALGGMAADTAMGGLGMGATNVAMGEVGRHMQRQYDPGYQTGAEGDAARTEEFMSGLPMGAAVAAPHAVLAHTFGAANDGTRSAREIVGAGAKAVGSAAYEAMPAAAKAAVDTVVGGGKMTADGVSALKPYYDKLKGKVKDAYDAAAQQYGETLTQKTNEATAANQEAGAGETSYAAGAAARRGLDTFIKSVMPEDPLADIGQALKKFASRARDLAVGADNPTRKQDIAGTFNQLRELLQGEHTDDVHVQNLRELWKEYSADPSGIDKDLERSSDMMLRLYDTVEHLANREDSSIVTPPAKEQEPTGPRSESSDVGASITKKHLDAAGLGAMGDLIANMMQVRQMIRPGVTARIRELRSNIREIVNNHPSTQGLAQPEKDEIFNRAMQALEAARPELAAEREKSRKDVPYVTSRDPDALHEAVTGAARKLFAGTAVAKDEEHFEGQVQGIAKILTDAAEGKRGWERNISHFAEGLERRYPERADEFIDSVVAAAHDAYGHNSPAAKRLMDLGVGIYGAKDTLKSFAMSLRNPPKPGELSRVLRAFRSDLDTAEAYAAGTSKDEEFRAKLMKKTGRDPMQKFRERWEPYFKDAASFDRAVAAAERWKEDNVPHDYVGQDRQASQHAVLEDENDNEVRQRAAEKEGQGEDDEWKAQQTEEHTGTQGEVEEPKPYQYHGETSLRGMHREDEVSAPVTARQSGDYPEGMGARTLAQMRAVWGDKRVADIDGKLVRMNEWADEMSRRTGRSRESLLNEALDKLLAHDQRRLQSQNLTQTDRDWIRNRAEHAASMAGHPSRGVSFFNERGPNRHYGYYEMRGATGENVAITNKVLEHFAPPIHDSNRASTEAYARYRASQEGVSTDVVMRSMMNVLTKNGVVPVDVARMLLSMLSKHQQGDVAGVEDQEGGERWLKNSQETRRIYTDRELARAFATLMGALHDGEGVKGFQIKPDTVIYRDPDLKLVRTVHDVTRLLGTDKNGRMVFEPRATTGQDMDRILPDQGKADTPTTKEGNAKDAANNGVLRNFYPRMDLNLHELMKHMMVLHGLDPYELHNMPLGMAAEMLRKGLRETMTEQAGEHELKKGITHPLQGELFDKGDVRNAWKDAVVYRRDYGGTETEPITLGRLLERPVIKDLPLHDFESARLAEAQHTKANMGKTRAELAAQGPLGKANVATWTGINRKQGEARIEALVGQRKALIEAWNQKLKSGEALPAGRGEVLNRRLNIIDKQLADLRSSLRSPNEKLADEREAGAWDAEVNVLDQGEKKTEALKNSVSEMGQMRVDEAKRESEGALFDTSQAVKGEREPPPGPSHEALRERAEAREHGAAGERVNAEQRFAETGQRADGKATDYEVKSPWQRKESPIDVRFNHPLLRDDRNLPKQTQELRLSEDEQAYNLGKDAVRQLKEKRAPAEGVATTPTSKKSVRPGQELRAQARGLEAERARQQEANRAAQEELDRVTRKQQEARADKQRIESDMLGKDPAKLTPLERLRQERQERTARELLNTAEKMGGNAADLSRDPPFSESSARGEKTPEERVSEHEAALKAEAQKLAGNLVENVKLGDHDFAGMWEAAKKTIHMAFGAEHGVLHHEVWHAVEEHLKSMGKDGNRILSNIYKHVDSPLMRKRLEELYKSDAGALRQIREGDVRERAAFAFQAHMKGETLPLHPETRTVWEHIKGFLMKAARILGYGNEGHITKNFFDYVQQGHFARDKDNLASISRSTGESGLQRMVQGNDGILKGLGDAVTTLAGYTYDRMAKTGEAGTPVQAHMELRHLYAGSSGKGGYYRDTTMHMNRFGNILARALEDGKATAEGLQSFDQMFQKYMQDAGLEDHDIARVQKYQGWNKKAIYDNPEAFIHDVMTNHSELPPAELRKIANDIINTGFNDNDELPKLFEDKPALLQKWTDNDPYSDRQAMVFKGVRLAERRRYFDEKIKVNGKEVWGDPFNKRDRLLKEGAESATPDGRRFADNFVAAYENRLGTGMMSPEVTKIMGALVVANNLRALPTAIFSQMLEPTQLGLRAGDASKAFEALWRGIKDMPRSFRSDEADATYPKDYWEKLAEDIGTVASAQSGGMLSAMFNGIPIRGIAGKLNDALFKYNFMDQWNRSMHIAATKMGVEFLKDHAAGIDAKNSERYLQELDLNKDDVKVDGEGQLIRNDKVDRALTQFTYEALAHPDPGSNPLWMNDPRFTLLAQMKRFNFAFSKYVMGRAVKEWGAGNPYVLASMASSVVASSAGDWLRNSLTGMFSDNPSTYADTLSTPDYLLFRLERSGFTGRAAPLLAAYRDIEQGGTGIPTLLGPTAELFSKVATETHKHGLLDGLMSGLPGREMMTMAE